MNLICNASYQFITHVSCRELKIIMQYKRFNSQDLHRERITLLANYGLLYWHHLVLSRLRNGKRIVFHF